MTSPVSRIERAFLALSDLELSVMAQQRPGTLPQRVPLPRLDQFTTWQDTELNLSCARGTLVHRTGTYTVFLELEHEPDRNEDGEEMLIVRGCVVRGNDAPEFPGEKGGWLLEFPTSGPDFSATALATNPLGWIPDPSMMLWTHAARTLPAFREQSFRFVVAIGGSAEDAWNLALEGAPIRRGTAFAIPWPSGLAPQEMVEPARTQNARNYLRSLVGVQTPWHDHGLDEHPDYGAAADRARFGVHPLGFKPVAGSYSLLMQHVLFGTLGVHGNRPIGITGIPFDLPGTHPSSVFCHDEGPHRVSSWQHGYTRRADGSFSPEKGTNGWNGPGGEHGSSALAEIAWHTGDLYAYDRVMREARVALTLVHDSYYESSGYFSERRLQRPFGQAMRADMLALSKDQALHSRLLFLLDLWLRTKVQNPPQHPPRRDDEDTPGPGNVVDTWQLGIDAAAWWAYAQYLAGKSPEASAVADLIFQHLERCQRFQLDAWFAPGETDRAGVATAYWRMAKQSSADNPRNYSSLLGLTADGQYDHRILDWSHQLLALPIELLFEDLRQKRAGILTAFEVTRQMFSRPTKWSGPEPRLWASWIFPTRT